MFESDSKRLGNAGSVLLQEFEGKQLADSLHKHPFYELCFIGQGSGDWQMGAVRGRFSAGTVAVFPPGRLHLWQSDPVPQVGKPASGIVLRFTRSSLPKGLLKLPEMSAIRSLSQQMDRGAIFSAPDRERLRARLRSIDRAKGALRLARFYVALELLAGLKIVQVSENEGLESILSEKEVARFEASKRVIDQRFSSGVSRAEVARSVGLEESVFSRFFRKASGATFVDYLASVRVRHAARLLGSRRDLSVPDIARASGFRNVSGFHRQFKRKLGTTPEAYRKAANAENLVP